MPRDISLDGLREERYLLIKLVDVDYEAEGRVAWRKGGGWSFRLVSLVYVPQFVSP